MQNSAVQEPDIVVARERMAPEELSRLLSLYFRDMVKFVVDVQTGTIAIGGELHADAEQVLIEQGSQRRDLWGGNYYPHRGRDACIEYTSMINIRPSQGNRSMLVEDPDVIGRVRAVVFAVIGQGEDQP